MWHVALWLLLGSGAGLLLFNLISLPDDGG